MERLTFEGNFCDIAQCRDVPGGSFCEDGSCSQKKVWTRLKSYEDTGLTPKEVTAQGELFDYALKESKTLAEQLTLLKHIRELAEAEKDGRVVVLPCKVGDTIWRLKRTFETYPDTQTARLCLMCGIALNADTASTTARITRIACRNTAPTVAQGWTEVLNNEKSV